MDPEIEQNQQVAEEPAAPVEAQEPAPPRVREDDDGNVHVALEEERPRPSRKERRAEHSEEIIRRYQQENEALRARQTALEAQVAARLAQVEQRQPTKKDEDPGEREVASIRREQEIILAAMRSGTVTSEHELSRLRDRYYELDGKHDEIKGERLTRKVLEQVRQQQTTRSGDYEEQALKSEFPDVIANSAALRWATGQYYQAVAEGAPANLETSRKAMLAAAERWRLRQPSAPAPSDAQRARYGAVAAQAGTKGGGNEVRLDTSQKRMAVARWPHDEEHVAYAKMAALLRKSDGGASADD